LGVVFSCEGNTAPHSPWLTSRGLRKFKSTGTNIRFVDGEDTNRTGVLIPNADLYFEGTGFRFPWADLDKGEKWKAIKFYNADTNVFLFQLYQSWPSEQIRWSNVENVNEAGATAVTESATTGGRKAIVISNGHVPVVLDQYPDYNKFSPFTDAWMNFTCREYYLNSPGDTGMTGQTALQMLMQIQSRLKFPSGPDFMEGGGPFKGYTVEVWHESVSRHVMDERDWGIEHYAGLTRDNLTRISGPTYATANVLSHEFGHRYQNACNPNSMVGGILKNEYARLRGFDFTTRTTDVERFAKDFRFFFGANGSVATVDADDDCNLPSVDGKKIRHPSAVPGLMQLMRGSWPVYFYLSARQFVSFSYNDTTSEFQWYANGRWERFVNGQFIAYDGHSWQTIVH
jgi:hypothetical protein